MTEYKEELLVIVDSVFNIKHVFDNESEANDVFVELERTQPEREFEVHKLSEVGNIAYKAGHEEGFESGYNDGKEEAEDSE